MDDLTQTILRLAAERGPDKSLCPSEAARAVDAEGWRRLMPAVRSAAVALAQDGRLVITRKGKPVDPNDFKGVYRLRVAPDAPDAS